MNLKPQQQPAEHRATPHPSRLAALLDRAIGAALAATLLVGILAFGAQVWWFPLALATLASILVVCAIARCAIAGRGGLPRSPLSGVFALLIALGCVQIAPLPQQFTQDLSARDDVSLERLEALATGSVRDEPRQHTPSGAPSVVSADRARTLRWVGTALALFGIFLVTGAYVDRLSRLKLVCGALALGFCITTLSAGLQVINASPGAYGLWTPGEGPAWAPGINDVLNGPGTLRLRAADPDPDAPRSGWLVRRPNIPFAIGPLIAGAGAYVALAALALPLTLALLLDRLAPRGSSEPLASRLRHEGGAASAIVLTMILAGGSALAGYCGGWILGSAVASGIALVGLLAARKVGVPRAATILTLLSLVTLFTSAALGHQFGRPAGAPWLAEPAGWPLVRGLWRNALLIGRAFPLYGVGLDAFRTIEPYLKSSDVTSTTAHSSLLQLWAEAGGVGVALLCIGAIWAACRLPAAWRAVGTADRHLAAGLLGAIVSLAVLSALCWTFQQPAIALTAAAIAGCANRWLAGGTDLFAH